MLAILTGYSTWKALIYMSKHREEPPKIERQDEYHPDEQDDLVIINQLLTETLLRILRCSPKIRRLYAVTAAAIKLQICPPAV